MVTDWFQSQGNSPNEIHISRILQVDMEGDGSLEVIAEFRQWEHWGLIVYRVDGQNAREVLRTICGVP